MDIDDLSITSGKKNFVADADKMLVSTFSNRLFYRDKVRFDLDLEKKMKEIHWLCLDDDSASDREGSSTSQTTESINNETQEAMMHNS